MDRGISKIYDYTHPDAEMLDQMLQEEPEIFALKPQKSLESWRKLGPLTVEEIMRNSEYEVTFSKDNIKFQIDNFGKGTSIGQLRKGTKVPDGIARVVFESTNIQEG